MQVQVQVDEINELFTIARDEIEYAQEESETVSHLHMACIAGIHGLQSLLVFRWRTWPRVDQSSQEVQHVVDMHTVRTDVHIVVHIVAHTGAHAVGQGHASHVHHC